MKTWFLILLMASFPGQGLLAQITGHTSEIPDPENILFADTSGSIVTDSLVHDMGLVPDTNTRLVKYFKYTGKQPSVITRTWTGDPHYICDYPKEPLIAGKIYKIDVCFSFAGRKGIFSKPMGFDLSNGERITFIFKGFIREEPAK